MPPPERSIAARLDLNTVRRRIELREDLLSPHAVKSAGSRGRARPEPPSEVRSEFQRDRDRVIHTNSFRRLKHKSQVFVAPQGDHFTTRLTHVIEVAQVGRTIARALNLNEDLVEAAALAHDLGHTPFGHIGESVLNEMLDGGFHHSRHSVRIVETLEKEGRGLNLTGEVIDAIRYHSKPEGEFLSQSAVSHMTLEAQVVRISDALAYLAHDISDALRSGFLTIDDLPHEIVERLGERHSQRVNSLVTDVVAASWDCTGEIDPEGERPWVRLSADLGALTTSLRDFMFERFYHPISGSREGRKAADIVRVLLEYCRANPDEMPPWLRDISGSDEQAAADHVCGMTDNYALTMAERIRPGLSGDVFKGRI
ncbi:MAG: deoxyguanosinetriphosphate triphosphohydrolase [Chloroflexi bacterium]|nr:deoxyguanosinetriphosphate triphosphohydrolase [Chloroflexota bacterium]